MQQFSNGTNHSQSNVPVDVKFKYRKVKVIMDNNKSIFSSKMSHSIAIVFLPNELLSMLIGQYTKLSKIV